MVRIRKYCSEKGDSLIAKKGKESEYTYVLVMYAINR